MRANSPTFTTPHCPKTLHSPIGLISMTSIDDCGICKCGWFSNNFVAASCDTAFMIEYNIISFLVSEIPLEVTRLVFPPASVLTIIFECAPSAAPDALARGSVPARSRSYETRYRGAPCGCACALFGSRARQVWAVFYNFSAAIREMQGRAKSRQRRFGTRSLILGTKLPNPNGMARPL